jgi:DGQHR domain-containing protein
MAANAGNSELKVNALRVTQNRDIPLFVFGIDGSELHKFAAINIADRSGSGELHGYQRDQVKNHIKQIATYLNTDGALLPNALVVAFDGSATFTPLDGEIGSEWGTLGRLTIPIPKSGEPKPAFVVDGQQRMSALAHLDGKKFPVVVVGFSSSSERVQREQFILVNNSKPLPRDLINQLVADVDVVLPKSLEIRKATSKVVQKLNSQPESPFYQRIKLLGSKSEGANISQKSVLEVIEQSLKSGGVLEQFYDPTTGKADPAEMTRIVSLYFTGVRRVWFEAWEGSPKTSRLVHGAGMFAMGKLMDVVMADIDLSKPRPDLSIDHHLKKLERKCAWTSGRWPVLNVQWNELQNTSQDKRRLQTYLISEYAKR